MTVNLKKENLPKLE